MAHRVPLIVLTSVMIALGGCFEDDNENRLRAPPPGENAAPTISGSPPAVVLAGQLYEFTPTASDADGDALEFSIARKPAWARFDRATGRLSGTPVAQDVGNFTNISISVSDGQGAAALSNFDISVDAIAVGSATLSWNPPLQNADGSALTDLTGYKIYYGRDAKNLGRSLVIDNPGLTRFVIENLTPARWYFTMTSVNTDGVESGRSALVSKTIG
jgi:hypothetical protein